MKTKKQEVSRGLKQKMEIIYNRYGKKEMSYALSISIFSLFLFVLDQLVLSNIIHPLFSIFLMLFSVLGMTGPIISLQYKYYKRMKNIEANFPNFIKAISEGLSSNMSLPQSVKYAAKSDFGALNPYLEHLVSQMTWGVSFEDAFTNMASSIDNRLITRAVSTILEAHTYGGKIAKAMESIGKTITDIEKLQRERVSTISSQMMQGYVIFFVFVGVMIGLVVFLLPALSSGALGTEPGSTTDLAAIYSIKFKHLSILQGFFSGLAIGKLSEGYISAGFKHAIVMSFIGYAALTIATI